MCGIAAVIHKDKRQDACIETRTKFLAQRGRGTEGFGLITVDDGGAMKLDRMTEIEEALCLFRMREGSPVALFHHRFPTSSDNTLNQTHPILIRHKPFKYDYYFLHNGIIQNSDKLFTEHSTEGYTYSTEFKRKSGYYGYNDSESLGYEIAGFIEGKRKTIKASGSAAFIMAQVSRKDGKITRVYFGRNHSNPLKLEVHEKTGRYSLASEGAGNDVPPNVLWWYSYPSMKLESKKMVVPGYGYGSWDDKDDEKPKALYYSEGMVWDSSKNCYVPKANTASTGSTTKSSVDIALEEADKQAKQGGTTTGARLLKPTTHPPENTPLTDRALVRVMGPAGSDTDEDDEYEEETEELANEAQSIIVWLDDQLAQLADDIRAGDAEPTTALNHLTDEFRDRVKELVDLASIAGVRTASKVSDTQPVM